MPSWRLPVHTASFCKAMAQNKNRAISATGIRSLVLCGIFAAITAVLSQIILPIGPVPISCSLIAVYLTGLFLPAKSAVICQLVYLLLGIVGVPVFAGFQAGTARLAGPTGGYLLVYPLISLLLACFMQVYDKHLTNKAFALRAAYLSGILLLALLLCYTGGTAWFTVFAGTTFREALALTALPFVAGDIAKIVLCVVLTLLARTRLKKAMQRKA